MSDQRRPTYGELRLLSFAIAHFNPTRLTPAWFDDLQGHAAHVAEACMARGWVKARKVFERSARRPRRLWNFHTEWRITPAGMRAFVDSIAPGPGRHDSSCDKERFRNSGIAFGCSCGAETAQRDGGR